MRPFENDEVGGVDGGDGDDVRGKNLMAKRVSVFGLTWVIPGEGVLLVVTGVPGRFCEEGMKSEGLEGREALVIAIDTDGES